MSDPGLSCIIELAGNSANQSGSSGIARVDIGGELLGVGDDRNRRRSYASSL